MGCFLISFCLGNTIFPFRDCLSRYTKYFCHKFLSLITSLILSFVFLSSLQGSLIYCYYQTTTKKEGIAFLTHTNINKICCINSKHHNALPLNKFFLLPCKSPYKSTDCNQNKCINDIFSNDGNWTNYPGNT